MSLNYSQRQLEDIRDLLLELFPEKHVTNMGSGFMAPPYVVAAFGSSQVMITFHDSVPKAAREEIGEYVIHLAACENTMRRFPGHPETAFFTVTMPNQLLSPFLRWITPYVQSSYCQ